MMWEEEEIAGTGRGLRAVGREHRGSLWGRKWAKLNHRTKIHFKSSLVQFRFSLSVLMNPNQPQLTNQRVLMNFLVLFFLVRAHPMSQDETQCQGNVSLPTDCIQTQAMVGRWGPFWRNDERSAVTTSSLAFSLLPPWIRSVSNPLPPGLTAFAFATNPSFEAEHPNRYGQY